MICLFVLIVCFPVGLTWFVFCLVFWFGADVLWSINPICGRWCWWIGFGAIAWFVDGGFRWVLVVRID